MTTYQDDLFAQRRKLSMLAKVEANAVPWFDQCITAGADLAATHPGTIVTGESIRSLIESQIGPPGHHNVWGAAVARMVRLKYLSPTGEWVPMTGHKSNARRTPAYRLVKP